MGQLELMKEDIILVNEKDQQIGIGFKMNVHKKGLLHRAFSVFIFNSKNELLLQKRAKAKYHSGGLWTNTCCGHPKPGQEIMEAASIRLQEEMGFTCSLTDIFNFIYKAELDHNMIEHEFDYAFIGNFDKTPVPNVTEVEDWKWVNLQDLIQDIKKNPEIYSYWFKQSLSKVIKHLK
jgi:isopentenyl-diphosphate Delta-isomerase